MPAREALHQALAQNLPEFLGAKTCFLGFSGGLDSSVLLHALLSFVPADRSDKPSANGGTGAASFPDLQTPPGLKLRALHANHGLHGDAGLWEKHCAAICAAWGVELSTTSLAIRDAGAGLESAARDARYAWFASHLGPGDCLLLAHHQDDQAETLLLRLLRGAGAEGLSAMPARRELGAGRLLRPLLEVPRSLILDYARAHDLCWIEDPSNQEDRFDRNYLRREVMPLIEARWPGYRTTLTRAASHLRELANQVQAQVPKLHLRYSATMDPGFAIAELSDSRDEACIAVRLWLREHGLRMPPSVRLQEFLRQIAEGKGAQLATGEWILQRYRDGVYAYLPVSATPPAAQVIESVACLSVPQVGRLRLNSRPDVSFDGAALYLGFRRGGERLEGFDGRHKDLKTVFQEHGVPPWWRDRVPLLMACGGGDRELLAVGSFARSPRAIGSNLELHWEPASLTSQ